MMATSTLIVVGRIDETHNIVEFSGILENALVLALGNHAAIKADEEFAQFAASFTKPSNADALGSNYMSLVGNHLIRVQYNPTGEQFYSALRAAMEHALNSQRKSVNEASVDGRVCIIYVGQVLGCTGEWLLSDSALDGQHVLHRLDSQAARLWWPQLDTYPNLNDQITLKIVTPLAGTGTKWPISKGHILSSHVDIHLCKLHLSIDASLQENGKTVMKNNINSATHEGIRTLAYLVLDQHTPLPHQLVDGQSAQPPLNCALSAQRPALYLFPGGGLNSLSSGVFTLRGFTVLLGGAYASHSPPNWWPMIRNLPKLDALVFPDWSASNVLSHRFVTNLLKMGTDQSQLIGELLVPPPTTSNQPTEDNDLVLNLPCTKAATQTTCWAGHTIATNVLPQATILYSKFGWGELKLQPLNQRAGLVLMWSASQDANVPPLRILLPTTQLLDASPTQALGRLLKALASVPQLQAANGRPEKNGTRKPATTTETSVKQAKPVPARTIPPRPATATIPSRTVPSSTQPTRPALTKRPTREAKPTTKAPTPTHTRTTTDIGRTSGTTKSTSRPQTAPIQRGGTTTKPSLTKPTPNLKKPATTSTSSRLTEHSKLVESKQQAAKKPIGTTITQRPESKSTTKDKIPVATTTTAKPQHPRPSESNGNERLELAPMDPLMSDWKSLEQSPLEQTEKDESSDDNIEPPPPPTSAADLYKVHKVEHLNELDEIRMEKQLESTTENQPTLLASEEAKFVPTQEETKADEPTVNHQPADELNTFVTNPEIVDSYPNVTVEGDSSVEQIPKDSGLTESPASQGLDMNNEISPVVKLTDSHPSPMTEEESDNQLHNQQFLLDEKLVEQELVASEPVPVAEKQPDAVSEPDMHVELHDEAYSGVPLFIGREEDGLCSVNKAFPVLSDGPIAPDTSNLIMAEPKMGDPQDFFNEPGSHGIIQLDQSNESHDVHQAIKDEDQKEADHDIKVSESYEPFKLDQLHEVSVSLTEDVILLADSLEHLDNMEDLDPSLDTECKIDEPISETAPVEDLPKPDEQHTAAFKSTEDVVSHEVAPTVASALPVAVETCDDSTGIVKNVPPILDELPAASDEPSGVLDQVITHTDDKGEEELIVEHEDHQLHAEVSHVVTDTTFSDLWNEGANLDDIALTDMNQYTHLSENDSSKLLSSDVVSVTDTKLSDASEQDSKFVDDVPTDTNKLTSSQPHHTSKQLITDTSVVARDDDDVIIPLNESCSSSGDHAHQHSEEPLADTDIQDAVDHETIHDDASSLGHLDHQHSPGYIDNQSAGLHPTHLSENDSYKLLSSDVVSITDTKLSDASEKDSKFVDDAPTDTNQLTSSQPHHTSEQLLTDTSVVARDDEDVIIPLNQSCSSSGDHAHQHSEEPLADTDIQDAVDQETKHDDACSSGHLDHQHSPGYIDNQSAGLHPTDILAVSECDSFKQEGHVYDMDLVTSTPIKPSESLPVESESAFDRDTSIQLGVSQEPDLPTSSDVELNDREVYIGSFHPTHVTTDGEGQISTTGVVEQPKYETIIGWEHNVEKTDYPLQPDPSAGIYLRSLVESDLFQQVDSTTDEDLDSLVGKNMDMVHSDESDITNIVPLIGFEPLVVDPSMDQTDEKLILISPASEASIDSVVHNVPTTTDEQVTSTGEGEETNKPSQLGFEHMQGDENYQNNGVHTTEYNVMKNGSILPPDGDQPDEHMMPGLLEPYPSSTVDMDSPELQAKDPPYPSKNGTNPFNMPETVMRQDDDDDELVGLTTDHKDMFNPSMNVAKTFSNPLNLPETTMRLDDDGDQLDGLTTDHKDVFDPSTNGAKTFSNPFNMPETTMRLCDDGDQLICLTTDHKEDMFDPSTNGTKNFSKLFNMPETTMNMKDDDCLTTDHKDKNVFDPLQAWGKPEGLPTPIMPTTTGRTAGNRTNPTGRSTSSTTRPTTGTQSRPGAKRGISPPQLPAGPPVYLDLIWVPTYLVHVSQSMAVEFFNRVRARIYVISGEALHPLIGEALIEGKSKWNPQDVELLCQSHKPDNGSAPLISILPTDEAFEWKCWLHTPCGRNDKQTGETRLRTSGFEVLPAVSLCDIEYSAGSDASFRCEGTRIGF